MAKLSALVSIFGVILLWPSVLTKSITSILHATHADSSMSAGHAEERLRVVKRSTQHCDSSYANYCMNGGQCMLLVDVNEHHCKCHSGFYGPRCSNLELVFKPIGEEQIIFIIFCVTLLTVGLAGAVYCCCKYKRNKCNPPKKRQGYKGVQAM
ncbi:proepiregulin-like isoform X2 [Syngnathus typhle]|uniref:proepiregulin-like isoform X2 n=1 Tax=Syngnathus typhle TaxID=161592 RepID=UPI002A6B7222|nr:proepiregulin-like isoform X2 [Syngnathus typhle]